jgi:hypothetical protein
MINLYTDRETVEGWGNSFIWWPAFC